MKLLIDDADVKEIRRLCDIYEIDGVTTNPTILAKAKRNPRDVLCEIREIIGDDKLLFAQVIPTDYEGMLEDARAIVSLLGENTVVKLPSIPEGFKAMKQLKKEGIVTCGTVVYTPMQAYLAAKAGASYVAPYVNRIDNMGYDGIGVVRKIQNILENSGYDCIVLAASFKNSQQVMELCEYGIGAATCAPSVIDAFCNNPAIDKAVTDFISDFEKAFGSGAVMRNL